MQLFIVFALNVKSNDFNYAIYYNLFRYTKLCLIVQYITLVINGKCCSVPVYDKAMVISETLVYLAITNTTSTSSKLHLSINKSVYML